jgi:steroid 5-alpha reductase family enzyme
MKNRIQTGKSVGLIINLVVYVGAFALALIPFLLIEDLMLAEMAFTTTATVIIYIISVFISDTSLYDPYWSVAPPIMVLVAMVRENLWYINGMVVLAAITVWSARLTMNWIKTYRGIGYEDWRYAKFRKNLKKVPFELLNFFGFMMMPSIVTYAGLMGTFHIIRDNRENILVWTGVFVMGLGVMLEHLADTALHDFLDQNRGSRLTCREGVWKYSRHPNYLGEMTFWTGLYVAYYALFAENWQGGLGFLLIICVFVFASIPLMENHNLERRVDYRDYMEETSVLIPMPPKTRTGNKTDII